MKPLREDDVIKLKKRMCMYVGVYVPTACIYLLLHAEARGCHEGSSSVTLYLVFD